MKSIKPVIPLDKICLPYKVTFPVTVEGSVNNDNFKFFKDIPVELTYSQYEVLVNSSYKDLL